MYMYGDFLNNYLTIIIFFGVALLLSIGFIFLNFVFAPKNPDPEKLSAYECGFEPFNDSRMEFDVRFYLVAILFIIFDLEAIYFFPWCISLSFLSSDGLWGMIDFVIELIAGYIYAWEVGALEWE